MSFLCSFVSDKMGGPVDRESLSTFSYELSIGQLKVELNSNIIPIGKIQTGIFYHRALLFKVNLGYVHTAPDEFRPAKNLTRLGSHETVQYFICPVQTEL